MFAVRFHGRGGQGVVTAAELLAAAAGNAAAARAAFEFVAAELVKGIIKIGSGNYEIDYDYCKGCGICAAECPCGAIAMVPEEA